MKNQAKHALTSVEATYLRGMIHHHEMALVMANDVLKVSTDDDIIFLSYEIIRTQINEIALMRQMLDERA